jgi:hypothetical protein
MSGLIITVIVESILLLLTYSVLGYYGWNAWSDARKRKKEITERLDRSGTHVNARVTDVIMKGRIKFDVSATWYGIETGQPYIFHKTYFFPLGIFGLPPYILEGDYLSVKVALRTRPLVYLIEGKK